MKKSGTSKSVGLFGALLLLSLAACGAPRGGQPAAGATPHAPPQRIISFSPSSTEVLYGIGAFDRVVAVSQYDEFPPEVARLPRVGGWSNTNMEQVAALKPDLIIIT